MAAALFDADVIISAATFFWPDVIYKSFKFHRVVVDESHMFQTAPGSINMDKASMVPTSMRWGATGTPASASLADFAKQLQFLCRCDVKTYIPDLAHFGGRFLSRANEAASWNTFLDKVGAFTVRHTKSQCIGGADALALPSATTTTVMLTMSSQEKEVYKIAKARTTVPANCFNNGAKAFTLQRYLAAEVGGEFLKALGRACDRGRGGTGISSAPPSLLSSFFVRALTYPTTHSLPPFLLSLFTRVFLLQPALSPTRILSTTTTRLSKQCTKSQPKAPF